MGCSFGGRKTEWVIDFVEIFGLGFDRFRVVFWSFVGCFLVAYFYG